MATRNGRTIGAVLGALILGTVLGAPAELQAQPAMDEESGWALAPRVGFAFPTGQLDRLVDPGPMAGLGAVYHLSDRAGLSLDADAEVLDSQSFAATGTSSPEMRLWHFTGGAVIKFTNPEQAPGWLTALRFGGGVTLMETDDFGPVTNPFTGNSVSSFSEIHPTGYVGVNLGYRVTPSLRLSVGATGFGQITDSDKMAALNQTALGGAGMSTAASVPLYAEAHLRF